MNDLFEALRILLQKGEAATQEEICSTLERQGFEINQSKASRLLRKVGAIKMLNIKGETVYGLPHDPAPPSMNLSLHELILEIDCNETMVVIHTSPGSASMVARILDHQLSMNILGTLAGDDTVFVSPKSIKQTHALFKKVKSLLSV